MEGSRAPEEGANVLRLGRVDGSAHERVVPGRQVRLASENEVGRVFNLRQVPRVAQTEDVNAFSYIS
jgi:hypothetical protein